MNSPFVPLLQSKMAGPQHALLRVGYDSRYPLQPPWFPIQNDNRWVSHRIQDSNCVVRGRGKHGLKWNRLNRANWPFWRIDLANQTNSYNAIHDLHSDLVPLLMADP